LFLRIFAEEIVSGGAICSDRSATAARCFRTALQI